MATIVTMVTMDMVTCAVDRFGISTDDSLGVDVWDLFEVSAVQVRGGGATVNAVYIGQLDS